MVSKGQFMGLDWNRITRLHSQVIGANSLTASRCLNYCRIYRTFGWICPILPCL